MSCGEAPAEGRRGAANEHPARGGLERRAGFLPKSSEPGQGFRAGNLCGSMLVPHPPSSPKRERWPLHPWSHFSAMWSWVNASHATRLHLPFQEAQEVAKMSTLSPGRSQNKSLFTIPSSAPLLVGKHSFIRS